MESISNEGMCRCCASEGTFKDFLTSYHWMGEEEIYADMLRDCFAITLYTSDDVNNGGICEVCITQLRNACNFKRQVQQTEEQFKKRVQNSGLKSNVIKLEMAGGDDGEHSDTNLSDEFSAAEFEVPIKEEKDEEKPKKRQAAKPSTSRAKKAKTEDGEPSAKRVEIETSFVEITIKQEPTSDTEERETKLETVVKIENVTDDNVSKKVTKDPKKGAADKKSKKDQILEMEKHLKNISTILLHTNATPIRYHDGANYVCALCPETYPLPSELKMHVLEEHDEIDKSSFMEGHRLTSYVVKLDITNLRCLICHSEIEGFDPMHHLRTAHGKELHTDIPNHILPFRFVGNGFDCVQCPKSFEHFKLIQEHMSIHYGNYICATCNAPFVNKRTMQNHANRHKKGDFPCSQCAKIFDTNRKKLNHEKFVHDGDYKRKKCPYCQEKFTNYAKKRSHMVQEHGAEPLSVKCEICKKTFSTRARLRGHTRRDHMECQHACTDCEMRFYTKLELVKHMVKHSPLREYQCDICQKAYARKHTLREHLKIHANIRKFKCELCEFTFVQKCSWKSHMRNKHKIKVP
ncbi:zinc finger protein 564-like isoform X2 [Nymphalis io]|uniref:zinc finger protein 564-like isoform X2 n=1 Tax=Inachis io TaxID=171585 RepID=UPI002166D3A4|nr:zinc finger protein 564-like isoform X2 [Nymphalis io]